MGIKVGRPYPSLLVRPWASNWGMNSGDAVRPPLQGPQCGGGSCGYPGRLGYAGEVRRGRVGSAAEGRGRVWIGGMAGR